MTLQTNQTEHVAEMLNDLVKINDDRAIRYQKALDRAIGVDNKLQNIFTSLIRQSTKHRNEIVEIMNEMGIPTYPNMHRKAGQLYRAWVDVTVAIPATDRKSILASCQYNEDIFQHTYIAALSGDLEIFQDIRELIEGQKRMLSETSDMINKCRHEYYLNMNSMRSLQYSPII